LTLSYHDIDQCHACRYPITDADKQHQHYEKGVACPRCFGTRSTEQLNRYKERQDKTMAKRINNDLYS
jgi:UPF0176 protein